MAKRILTALTLVATLAGCTADGSVNWDAVGAVTLGVGAAALGAAEIYENSRPVYYTPEPTIVVVCPRWSWSC